MKRPAKTVSLRRYTVDAAAKALDLLGAFSFREPRLSLAELAGRTGIPRPTAFRLLTTLEQAGFVAKENGEYQLGIKCFILGNIVASGLDLREKANPHLQQLRDATGETVHLAVLEGWQVLYLERLQSPHPIGFMRSRIGVVVPAYCTGLGKTLLAFKPADDGNDYGAAAVAEGAARDSRTRLRSRRTGARTRRPLSGGADLQSHR
jgi:DNA-binding IclR family transcriptional regulator